MSRKDLSGVKPLSGTITSDDILGKRVIDAEGEVIGNVDIVHIDPKTFDFVGISVDEGFFKRGIVLGKQYIRKISSQALFLNIRPAFALRSMLVFDKEGKEIGSVKDVVLVEHRNVIQELIVSIGMFKVLHIPGQLIDHIGVNIFLNCDRESLTPIKKA